MLLLLFFFCCCFLFCFLFFDGFMWLHFDICHVQFGVIHFFSSSAFAINLDLDKLRLFHLDRVNRKWRQLGTFAFIPSFALRAFRLIDWFLENLSTRLRLFKAFKFGNHIYCISIYFCIVLLKRICFFFFFFFAYSSIGYASFSNRSTSPIVGTLTETTSLGLE